MNYGASTYIALAHLSQFYARLQCSSEQPTVSEEPVASVFRVQAMLGG
jgi:hypothetical protein